MTIQKGQSYYARHIPTGEEWHLLGVNKSRDAVCCAGWPPTMANLSDCDILEAAGALSEHELNYRSEKFGDDWDN